MDQSEQRTEWQEMSPPSRRRGWITSSALVGTGLLAGGILAGTLSANAAEGGGGFAALSVPAAATSTATAPDDPDSQGPGHGWRGWWHGDDEAEVSDDVKAEVEDAVQAQYPDATTRWVRTDSDGGYVAYVDTADGKDVVVHLDDAFAITGSDELPDADGWRDHGWAGHRWDGACDDSATSVSDDVRAKVEDAVQAQYPDATVGWVRTDSDGGHVAYVDTADGKDVVVHLDDAFAITDSDELPDADERGHGGSAVSDEAAGQVEDAVLAQYPGASVPRIWAETDDGGYGAVVLTADDERVVVHLDDAFAITETESAPGC